ncbi:MAG: hypothetical protein JNJ83_06820 [Verrucomicrobiaceae bacterium]|nr:hypothetical protein [Verrucomicrobiaceae bacterium]
MKTRSLNTVLTGALRLGALTLALTGTAKSQSSYTAIDLSAPGSGSAMAIDDGIAGGFISSVPNATTGKAVLWTGDGVVSLHPTFLDGPTARSQVMGIFGNLQVGYGAGLTTSSRSVPLIWRDSAESAAVLNIPFTNFGGQANATDGAQVVGSAIGLNRDGTAIGSTHAMVWTLATGQAVDLGTDANAFDVAAGQQVGFVLKGQANAVLWRGSKAYTLLHPKGAVISTASATDGVRQVGNAGFDIRVRVEAVKGNKNKRFTYAYVWSGTSASGLNIHPYISTRDNTLFEGSYALDVAGSHIVGYATVPSAVGTPGYQRAVVWNASLEATDLSAFIPTQFIGSVAYGVDASGNIAGVMTKADGTRHAVIWVPNP